MGIKIQPLKAQDKDHWLPLWQGYLDFYNSELPQATTATTWQRIINDHSTIFGFGAWQDDKMVGFTHIVLHPNTWNTTDCCYLEDLFVNECVRGQGVGHALIEAVYQFAKEKDCNRVYWVTQEANTTARKLYDKIAKKTDFVQYRHTF